MQAPWVGSEGSSPSSSPALPGADDAVGTGLHFEPLTRVVGSQVMGVRLSDALSDTTVAALRSQLLSRGVLFFRGQHLTPAQQVAFARRLGTLTRAHPLVGGLDVAHPEVLLLDSAAYPLGVGSKRDGTSYNNKWHTDVTFASRPPLGSLLCAQQVPAAGGDTLWCSLTDAYATLSPPLRAALDGLNAWHTAAGAFPAGRGGELPPVLHPVVRVHEETGARGLFVNPVFTESIEGLSEVESEALLRLCHSHATQPERVVRWRWEAGDAVLWDNRSTMHYASADYAERRIMHRVTIEGTVPRGAHSPARL